MNLKTFSMIYCLLILSGFLAFVCVAEYHTTVITKYSFIDVWKDGNETVADYTAISVITDIYLYKIHYVDSWSQTWLLARGTNASWVIQEALGAINQEGGAIMFHAGNYTIDAGLYRINNTIILGEGSILDGSN